MSLSRRAFLQTSLLAAATRAQGQTPSVAKRVTQGKHHWFGYYDKCPWNASGRFLLCQASDFADRQPKANETITVGMVDLHHDNKFVPFDTTAAWSWQQGTMLQWLGSDAENTVIYNSVADGQYVATMRNVSTGKTRTLSRPIYTVSADGSHAVSLDFGRTHRLRPGYGYATVPETKADVAAPEDRGIWHMDMATGKNSLIITIAQLAANQPDDRFKDAQHGIEHLQYNPPGTRVAFLHRWRKNDLSFSSRMYTCRTDGTDLKILHDSGQISHFDWRDEKTVLAWVRVKRNEPRLSFVLLDVDGKPMQDVFPEIKQDGHCSYSPNREWVLNDTYPDKKRLQHLMLLNARSGKRIDVGSFHSPPGYTGPVRCDLHPRWNRDGTQVCIDGSHDDHRAVYVIDVKALVG